MEHSACTGEQVIRSLWERAKKACNFTGETTIDLNNTFLAPCEGNCSMCTHGGTNRGFQRVAADSRKGRKWQDFINVGTLNTGYTYC